MKAVSGFPETSVPPTKLHDATSHKSVPVALTVVGNSNLTRKLYIYIVGFTDRYSFKLRTYKLR